MTLAHSAASSSTAHLPAPVEDDLARVETRLAAELASREERLYAIATHLVDAGGKRVRPTVVLLAFHAAAAGRSLSRRDDAVEAAVALELIHSATLLHDDIIDGGETRRGRPSAVAAFGVADTLVAGDFLFSRAFALCARFEAEIIERKTASLFAAGARTGAHLAGAPASLVEAMASCGRQLGLAFQVSDDLLDVTGQPSLTGKPRGIDLRDGNPSLPVVLALGRDDELARLFAADQLSAAEVEAGLARLRHAGILRAVA